MRADEGSGEAAFSRAFAAYLEVSHGWSRGENQENVRELVAGGGEVSDSAHEASSRGPYRQDAASPSVPVSKQVGRRKDVALPAKECQFC